MEYIFLNTNGTTDLIKWIFKRFFFLRRIALEFIHRNIYQSNSQFLVHHFNATPSPFESMLFYSLLGRIGLGIKAVVALLTHEKFAKKPILLEGFDEIPSPQTLYKTGSYTYLWPKSPLVQITQPIIENHYYDKIANAYTLAKNSENTLYKTPEWERITQIFRAQFFDTKGNIKPTALQNFRHTPQQYQAFFNDQFKYINLEDGYTKSYLEAIDLVLEFHRNAQKINKELLASVHESTCGNNECVYYQGRRISEKLLFHTLITDDILTHVVSSPHQKEIVLDIGAGYGGLSRLLATYLPKNCYILVDLPETLLLTAYFMKYNFPTKKILLFDDIVHKQTDMKDLMQTYDFIIVPPAVIQSIPKASIDLVINTASMGFMDQSYVTYYLTQINRILKTGGYFYSLNKEQTDHWGVGNFHWDYQANYLTIMFSYNNRFSYPQWLGQKTT